MKSEQSYTMKATGPRRGSCAELPEIRPSRFHRLGGLDITVWDCSYTVKSSSLNALAYAVERLCLDVEEIEIA